MTFKRHLLVYTIYSIYYSIYTEDLHINKRIFERYNVLVILRCQLCDQETTVKRLLKECTCPLGSSEVCQWG